MIIEVIQYDRYQSEYGVNYTHEYILGEKFEYMHGRWGTVEKIFEERYEGGIRYHVLFSDGIDLTVNNRDDINLIWK